MRNFLIFLSITVFCAIILYFTGNSLLQNSLENRLKSIPPELEKFGISTEPITFENIKVNSSRSLSILNIKTRYNFTNKEFFSTEDVFTFNIGEMLFEAQDYSYKKLKLTLKNVKIQSSQDYEIEEDKQARLESYDSIIFNFISTEFENNNSNPQQATMAIVEKIIFYLKNGKLDLPVHLIGNVILQNGINLKLVLADDFKVDTKEFEKLKNIDLTQAEIDFLSMHPLRLGTIVALKEKSIEFIKKASPEADPSAVKDIYYLINIKNKFQKNSDQIVNAYITDDKRKFYDEMASYYVSNHTTKAMLIKLTELQKKNFPVKSKASYSVN